MNEFDQAAAGIAGTATNADPIDRAAAVVVQDQREALRTTLYNSLLANPDVAARAVQLGRKAGIPADVAERNLPEVQRNVQLDEFDRVLKNSPTVAQWLTDQNNAKIAHDDVENLDALDKTLRFTRDTGRAALSGLQRASAGVVGLAQAPFELAAPLLDPLTGRILPANPLRVTAAGLSRYRQSIEGQAKGNTPKTDNVLEGGFYSGIGSLASNLAAMPLAFLPGGQGAALTAMTAPVGGQAYGEARDKGVQPLQAATFGASQAAIEYATEKIPMSRLIGDVKAGTPFFRTLARQVAAEIPGEQVATVLQDLNEWAVLNPEKPFSAYLEERPSAAAQTLVATIVGAGGQVAVVKGIDAAVQRITGRAERAQAAEQNAQALGQLDELARASKVRTRDADTFEAFVAQVAEDGPVQDVFIDANILMQSGNAEALAQVSPSVAEQLPAALAAGGEIRIPIAEYTARIAGTEYSQSLLDHLKTEPGGMSRAEAQEFMQSQAQALEQEVQRVLAEREGDAQFKAQADEVKATVKTQLDRVARFTPQVNDAYAAMVGNFYAVMGAKLGVSPQELFQRYPMRVAAEGVTGGQVLDQAAALRVVQPGDLVDGRVVREGVPNMESIGASLGDYRILEGVREVPMSMFDPEYIGSIRPERLDQRTRDLADQIKVSGELNPLIVAVDSKGAYIIEGGHRFDALIASGAKSLPAIVVVDESDPPAQKLNQPAFTADTIEADGKERPVLNSNGQRIAQTEEGLRNFWRWFGDSKVVDSEGRPLVVYHGEGVRYDPDTNTYTNPDFDVPVTYAETHDGIPLRSGFFASTSPVVASQYAGAGGIVYPVYLKAEKIAWSDAKGGHWKDFFKQGGAIEANARGAKKAGYDAYRIKNVVDQGNAASGEPPIADTWAVFFPTQIKSATGNRGTFDPQDANILNQSAADLIVTHNLTADNLLHAVKMGGIPVPSLAVTKKDNPLTGFGEITLIGDKAMADPKGYAGTKVFGADIYSPRYPSVTLEFTPNMKKRAEVQLKTGMEATDSTYIDWSEVERDGARELERNAAFLWTFLADRGIAPDVKRVQVEPLQPELAPFVDGGKDRLDLMKDEAFIATAWNLRRQFLVTANEGNEAQADAELAQEKARVAERGRFYFASELAGKIDTYRRDLRDNGKINREATRNALREQVREVDLTADLEAAAKAFIADINPNERIFQGYTNAGNRKYIPHTLENVVKILKKELRGGESFNYGVGSLRAKFTPQFKSIEQIRKAKDRLISKVDMEKVKGEIDNQFWEVARAINPDLSSNTAISIMEDAAKMGVKRAAKTYGYDVSDEVAVQVAEFLTRLRELPTEYFEAKILREVDLAEFAGAVVPEGVDPKVIEALQARGVKDIRTYKKGDEADRAAKIGEFENLFFQNKAGNRGAFNPATNTITLLKNADLSTFLHESGHFFLETQFDIASRLEGQRNDGASLSPGEEQILADTSVLLQWFGVRDLPEWYGMDFEQKRDYHERFARGFEAYLFEGKAPSIELQGLFQRFRAWLLNVYREIKALNVELTDEVRGVFDRMLATNEQIALAEQGRSMMPLFTSPEQAGMTVDEFAAYQALGTEATADAIQDVQARTLRDLAWTRNAKGREVKRLQKQAAALRAEVRMEVRREVMSQPGAEALEQALQFLTGKLTTEDKANMAPVEIPKSGKTLDPSQDSLFVAIAKLGGLDRKAVESAWGWDPKERSPQPTFGTYLLRREGGLSLDAMGEMLQEYGYLTPDENGKFDPAELEEKLQAEYGKFDPAELEEKFQAEYRGELQYSMAVNPAIFGPEGRPGEGVTTDNAGAGRLDLVALKSLGLPEEFVQIIQDLKMTARNGIHPDIVADMFGFTSGDELVRTLAIAQSPKVEIEGLTDARMLERYGDLATPEAIERAADKAIHNDARARFVATEANALAKATGQRKILASAARDFARAMIARLKVRDIRPGQYASAEVRAAKAAEKASQSGDLAKAAAEKRNQLVQNYATRAAYDAQDEVDKGLRYLRKFDADIKDLDADYADQIHALLERFDLRKGQSLKTIDKRTALAAWVEAQRDAGLEPEIPPELLNEAYRTSYKNLTVEEFRGLVDSVKQIEHLGRLKNRLLTAADNRAFDAVKDEIVASIEKHADGRTADTRTPTTNLGRWLQGIKNFGASHIKAATWARILDGGKDGGPVWEYLVRSANERGDMETTMRAEATTELSKILAPVFALGKMGGSGQFFPSIGRSLNREARLAIALNTGNQGNLQRLLGGEGWTVETITPVLQSLTAAEWQAVQAVWNHFESYRPAIGAKERRVYGKEPSWVDPQPFTIQTADGKEITLAGGYYPIKYDPAASQRAEEYADAEGAKRQLQGAFTSATTRRSFTKTRVEEVSGRPLLYTLAGLYSGVNDVIHDLTWHEWLIDVNRLLRNKAIDGAIRNAYGPAVKSQFKTWVSDIAEGDKGAQNAAEVALGRLRQGVSAAGLGFNVMSALMQVTGFNQSIVRVGARWVGKGIAQYIADPVGKTREVVDMSEFMADRSRTQFRELNELRNRVQDENATMRSVKLGTYFLMMRMQRMVDVPTWLGAYEKAIAEGNGEERAVALADQAVIDSQGSGMTKDLSAVERGGPALKLFTVFYSYMNTALNMGVARAMTEKSKARLAADMLMLYTVPVVLGTVLKAALTPGGDDEWDPEKLAKKLAAEQLSFLMGLMVVVREFGEVGKIITGAEGTGRDYGGPAGLRAIGDTFRFTQQASQGEFDDAFRKSAVNLLGDLTGLPAAQVNRTITGTQALVEGNTENPAAVLLGYQK
jgi:hypothetical protein